MKLRRQSSLLLGNTRTFLVSYTATTHLLTFDQVNVISLAELQSAFTHESQGTISTHDIKFIQFASTASSLQDYLT